VAGPGSCTQKNLKPYECDGLSAYRTTPMLVVLPPRPRAGADRAALCHQRQVPVVARGAGTGLSGGALPLEKGMLLVMARFNRILQSTRRRTARVQPGVRNLAISQAAAPMACTTRPTRPRRSPAPSAATSPKTPVACTA
jgi:glycolate oxidase